MIQIKYFPVLILFILSQHFAFSQDRYWVATTASSWNSNNWSNIAGGLPDGLGAPSSVQNAIFSSSNPANCSVNIAVSIEAIQINAGYTGTIDFNGNSFVINGGNDNIFADGVITDMTNSTTLNITSTAITTFSGTLFNVPLSVLSDRLYLNGSTFNFFSTLNKTGAGNDISNGGNIFNGPVSITNSGTAYLTMGNTSPDIFNRDLNLYNHGSNKILIAHNSLGNQFNGNVSLNTTSGDGIGFGQGAGANSSTLAADQLIYIGSDDFLTGNLEIKNFTQLGNIAQSIDVAGNAKIIFGSSTVFNASLSLSGPSITITGSTFNSTMTMIKTGQSSDLSSGNNTFNGSTQIINSGSGYFGMGNGSPDIFNDNLTITNSGSNHFFLAYNSIGNIVGKNLIINNFTTTNRDNIYISNDSGSTLTVTGDTRVINNGTGNKSNVYLGFSGSINFIGSLDLENIGNGIKSAIHLNYNPSSNNTYNENIKLTSTYGAGILFGNVGGTGVLASSKTINIQTAFTSGFLTFRNFTQNGNTPQSIVLSDSATFFSYDSDWGGDVNFVGPRIKTQGTQYRGKAYLEKTGSKNDNSLGQNIFDDITEIVNSGDGNFKLGKTFGDVFNSDLIVHNLGQSNTFIAHNSPGNEFNGKVFFYNLATDTTLNTCRINNGLNAISTFSDSVFFINAGNGYNQFQINRKGFATFNGPVTFQNLGTHSDNAIFCNRKTTGGVFNSNITVECNNGLGVFFGQGNGPTTLSPGATINVGLLGFTHGELYLKSFTQLGNTPQNINLTGSTKLTHFNSQWNGSVNFISPRIYMRTTVFNGDTYLEKSNNIDDDCYGDCTFNSPTTIHNSSSSRFTLCNNKGNDFNSSVTYIQSGSGILFPAYNNACTYAGDINIDYPISEQAVFASNNNGKVIMDGNLIQSINDVGNSQSPIIRRLEMNKNLNELNLNIPISISHELNLIKGLINTSALNLLTILDNGTLLTASNASYIEGPVEKIGDDSFTFPIGNGGFYRPISISAPSNSNSSFIGEYFLSNPSSAYNTFIKDPSLELISTCEYWNLERTEGNSNVFVTLSWNDSTGCGLKNLPQLKIARWDGNMWKDHGNSNTTASTISTGSPVNNFSPFTFTQFQPSLPVELLNFEAQRLNPTSVQIDWTTETETNNSGFEIQRMYDNESTFSKINWIEGAGNSLNVLNYKLIDENNYSGVAYYRLKQIDFDGTSSYSEIRSVIGVSREENIGITVFPNPVLEENLKVSLENLPQDTKSACLKIVAANGKHVYKNIISCIPHQIIEIEHIGSLTPGMYTLQLILNDGQQRLAKFIKQ
ncbi:MAG: hypothetical protein MK207_02355 [Saprospiraceae bacterium]|nr:hypothetical protein [Saprospiraceae bacterium]